MRRFLPRFLHGRYRGPAQRVPEPTASAPDKPLVSLEAARQAFGPLKSKADLAETARARIGPQIETSFRRYVGWLADLGYSFASCEETPLRFDTRHVYLRYDVHVRDLFGVFALASLHEELQIPGSFQICWEHSRAEKQVSRLFLKLRAFDRRFVQFGFHCAPESGWLIEEMFDGKSEGLDGFVADGGARRLVAEWLSAFEQSGHDAPALVEARRGADAHFAKTAASFQRHFGPARTISGHGTPLGAGYLQWVREEPRLAALAGYLHAVDYLTPARFQPHGFGCELTRFDEREAPRPRILFENPVAGMAEQYRHQFAGGCGFIVLFHPATWTSDHFLPFIDAVTMPGWAARARRARRPQARPRRLGKA